LINKQVFGAHEWATETANCINGCKHDCKYCYSKEMAIRFKRKTPYSWKIEELRESSLKKTFKKCSGSYMFPSSHDIHPEHLQENLMFLRKILSPGNNVLIVSKPHLECIKEICDRFSAYKDQILFRFTIGSADSNILKFWEPGAPDFDERLESLKLSYNLGFKTSISCEPMLDNHIEEVIKNSLPFVSDAIWIGKANFLLRRLKMNGYKDEKTISRSEQLIEWQRDSEILKLYDTFKKNNKIKWKESIKKVVGIELPSKRGLDI
jgi:DNA repair photolyase